MKLKEARKKLKMSQTSVAVKVGVSLTTYRLWEEGAMKPSQENRKKLFKVLGIKEEQEETIGGD